MADAFRPGPGAVTVTATERRAPAVAGRYRLLRKVGQGASKRVFHAYDEFIDRDVAIAFVADARHSATARVRLMTEVRALGRLGDHPHIVTIHDIGEDEGERFLVVEYLPGGSVAERLIAVGHRGLGARAAASITRDVCAALERVHGEDVVHRDVKPDNIWLARDGRALLGDFGIAISRREQDPRLRARAGTPGYMAPEQALDARSDLYAVGVTLRELLGSEPVPRLDELVTRLVDPEPERRPRSAADVRQELESFLDSLTGSGRLTADAPPLPGSIDEIRRGPFVAREPELELIERDWRAANAGKRRLVLVRGETGIGKSRLVAEFAARASSQGASVLHGRCYEDATIPYQPFVDALRHVAASSSLGDDERAALGHIVPEFGHSQVETTRDAQLGLHRLFEAVTNCLHRFAGQRPLVFVLDDIQWADRPTLQLLLHLLRHPARGGLLVLGTWQTPHALLGDPVRSLLSDLARDGLLRRIELPGLDAGGIRGLVEAATRARASTDLVDTLAELTDGNPLFVAEVVRDLSDGDGEEIGLPDGVREVIARRVARLSAGAAAVLRTAAVIGREFSLELLEAVLDDDGETAALGVEEAEAAGIVAAVPARIGSFAFGHALLRDAVYDGLGAAARTRLHRRLAELLADEDGVPPSVLAQHALLAGRREFTRRAVDYSVDAARQATDAFAYGDAAKHYERAVTALQSLGVEDARRCELLIALAHARWQAGLPNARQATRSAAALARELDLPALLARATATGRFYEVGVVDRRQIAMLEEALRRLGEDEPELRVRVLARLAEHLHVAGEDARSLALSAQALAIAEPLGAEATVAALGARHVALFDVAHADERLDVSARLIELALRSGHLDAAALAGHWRIYDLMETGAIEAARAEHVRLAALATDLRQPLYRHSAMAWRCVWWQLAGRLDIAERLADEQEQLARRARAADAASNRLAQQLGVNWQRGRLPELVSALEPLAGHSGPPVTWSAALALALAEAGREDEARTLLSELTADACAAVPRGLLWLTTLALLGETCARIGSREQALLLRDLLTPHRSRFVQFGYMTCFGSVERVLALLAARAGDADVAASEFAAAERQNASIDAEAMVTATVRDREWALG